MMFWFFVTFSNFSVIPELIGKENLDGYNWNLNTSLWSEFVDLNHSVTEAPKVLCFFKSNLPSVKTRCANLLFQISSSVLKLSVPIYFFKSNHQ